MILQGADCPLSTQPAACFAKLQESHILKANRHSWESIGSCHGCKIGRINAEIAFTPDPDDNREPEHFPRKIDQGDFITCNRGHQHSIHGVIRKDGKRRCRLCDSMRTRPKRDRRPY